MTRMIVCAVMDTAVQAYARPIFLPSVGMALRSFSDEVNRAAPDNQMNVHPDDFSLWVLAEFDDEAGMFLEPEGGRRVLVRGKDVKQKQE